MLLTHALALYVRCVLVGRRLPTVYQVNVIVPGGSTQRYEYQTSLFSIFGADDFFIQRTSEIKNEPFDLDKKVLALEFRDQTYE